MIKRKRLTPMAILVMLALSEDEKRIDTHIANRLASIKGTPRSSNGLRRVLRNLVAKGYANVTRINGCDYWTAA